MESEMPMQRKRRTTRKFPTVTVSECRSDRWVGWPRILERLEAFSASGQCADFLRVVLSGRSSRKHLSAALVEGLRPIEPDRHLRTCSRAPKKIDLMVSKVLGDDPVFGQMNSLEIEDFFDEVKLADAREKVKNWKKRASSLLSA